MQPLHARVGQLTLDAETIVASKSGVPIKRLLSISSEGSGSSEPDGLEFQWEVIERVLFVYAKLNPGIGYVQVRCLVAVNTLADEIFSFGQMFL